MAIKIGQIRYSGDDSVYLTAIDDYNIGILDELSENNKTFHNTIIQTSFEAGVTYYLRVPIKRIDLNDNMGDGVGENDAHRQIIDVKILNQEDNFSQTLTESYTIDPYYSGNISESWSMEDNFLHWCEDCVAANTVNINNPSYEGAQEYLTILRNKHGSSSKVNTNGIERPDQTLELIFTPYQNCNTLLFQLRRVGYDYISDVDRMIDFMTDYDGNPDLDLAVVNNVLRDVGGITSADKIGIQMAPGSLVVINGEGMRIGRSGVLELNCDIAITSVGFASPYRHIKNFILDYIYTE